MAKKNTAASTLADTLHKSEQIKHELENPVRESVKRITEELNQSRAVPQLPTRLDLFTAAALTGLMSHPASIPPTNLKAENLVEYCTAARILGQAQLNVCNAIEHEPQSSQPETPGANS